LADTTSMGLSDAQLAGRRKGGASWSPAKQSSVGVAFERWNAAQTELSRAYTGVLVRLRDEGWSYEALAALTGKNRKAVRFLVNKHRWKLREQARESKESTK
jgi:DNA-directed RNA polymerase specialized sigma24 family protein